MFKIILLFNIISLSFAKTLVVPGPSSIKDTRQEYFYDLIKLVFDNMSNESPYVLEYSLMGMNPLRILKSVQSKKIDIMWSMTSSKKEESLLPIKIPIMKNLIGYRICLISKTNKEKFNKKFSEGSIQALKYTQGRGWPDVKYLRGSGLFVQEGEYDSLFKLVKLNRVDCFPRSILEIGAEVDNQNYSKGLIVEDSFAIYYNAPMYFFVNKSNKELKTKIESSLKKIINNGEFNKLFNKHFGKILIKYKYKKRLEFQLKV